MTDDIVARLRRTLAGIARDECGGDNLSILLASYFEPAIEDDELDDSGTWKQGAIDACNKVLDAIHQHYATAIEAAEARVRELEAEVSGVSAAIGTTRFMDPPDGGSVTLSEQVARMRQALDAAEGRLSTIKSETIERCAKVADKHRAHVPNHDPEMQSDDLVAQGYGNAAFNIATAIRQLAQVKHEAE